MRSAAYGLSAGNFFFKKFTGTQNRAMGTSANRFTGSKNRPMRTSAFTLLEVMISVVIISVVITALLQMSANNTYAFFRFNKKISTNQYASFFISNPNFGLENKYTSLENILNDFQVEDSLRRELKSIRVNIQYDSQKTTISTKDSSISLSRLILQ